MKKPHANDKFYPDKTYRYFPGVAMIHAIDVVSFQEKLESITTEMRKQPIFEAFVFLKPASYHMTVADLITYKDLQTNTIYTDFPLKEEPRITHLDAYVQEMLGATIFPLDIEMMPVKITSRKVLFEPKTPKDAIRLQAFRNRIYDTLKIEPDQNYRFHISLTYRLNTVPDRDKAELEAYLEKLNATYLSQLGPLHIKKAELMAFNDMSQFRNIETGREKLGVCEIEAVDALILS